MMAWVLRFETKPCTIALRNGYNNRTVTKPAEFEKCSYKYWGRNIRNISLIGGGQQINKIRDVFDASRGTTVQGVQKSVILSQCFILRIFYCYGSSNHHVNASDPILFSNLGGMGNLFYSLRNYQSVQVRFISLDRTVYCSCGWCGFAVSPLSI